MYRIMNRQRGFTLIEIGIALTVIALLSVGAMSALQLAMLRARIAETRDAVQEAREAVVAFAVVNRSLPCPALPYRQPTAPNRAAPVAAARIGAACCPGRHSGCAASTAGATGSATRYRSHW